MSTFKNGDEVRLKKGLVSGKHYGGLHFNSSMYFSGSAEIVFVDRDNTFLLRSEICADISGYWYSYEMLESVDDTVNLVYAKLNENEKNYLFTVPSNVRLSKGDKVYGKVRSSELLLECTSDSFTITNDVLDILLSAQKISSLKMITGRAVLRKEEF